MVAAATTSIKEDQKHKTQSNENHPIGIFLVWERLIELVDHLSTRVQNVDAKKINIYRGSLFTYIERKKGISQEQAHFLINLN